jgi:hypothetical protein
MLIYLSSHTRIPAYPHTRIVEALEEAGQMDNTYIVFSRWDIYIYNRQLYTIIHNYTHLYTLKHTYTHLYTYIDTILYLDTIINTHNRHNYTHIYCI